jgi:hypothetical protein
MVCKIIKNSPNTQEEEIMKEINIQNWVKSWKCSKSEKFSNIYDDEDSEQSKPISICLFMELCVILKSILHLFWL